MFLFKIKLSWKYDYINYAVLLTLKLNERNPTKPNYSLRNDCIAADCQVIKFDWTSYFWNGHFIPDGKVKEKVFSLLCASENHG